MDSFWTFSSSAVSLFFHLEASVRLQTTLHPFLPHRIPLIRLRFYSSHRLLVSRPLKFNLKNDKLTVDQQHHTWCFIFEVEQSGKRVRKELLQCETDSSWSGETGAGTGSSHWGPGSGEEGDPFRHPAMTETQNTGSISWFTQSQRAETMETCRYYFMLWIHSGFETFRPIRENEAFSTMIQELKSMTFSKWSVINSGPFFNLLNRVYDAADEVLINTERREGLFSPNPFMSLNKDLQTPQMLKAIQTLTAAQELYQNET